MKKLLLVVMLCSFGSVFSEQKKTVERKETFEEMGKKIDNLLEKNDESLKILEALFPRRMCIRLLSSLMFGLTLPLITREQSLSGSIIAGISSAMGGEVVGQFFDEISGARKEDAQFWSNSKKIDELLKKREALFKKQEALLKEKKSFFRSFSSKNI
jgi:hypothetical protein